MSASIRRVVQGPERAGDCPAHRDEGSEHKPQLAIADPAIDRQGSLGAEPMGEQQAL
jgi:hypothetical protein